MTTPIDFTIPAALMQANPWPHIQRARALSMKEKTEVIIYIAENANSTDKHEVCRIVDFGGPIVGF